MKNHHFRSPVRPRSTDRKQGASADPVKSDPAFVVDTFSRQPPSMMFYTLNLRNR